MGSLLSSSTGDLTAPPTTMVALLFICAALLVSCHAESPPYTGEPEVLPPEFENGALRLAGGSVESEGRVEVYYNGEWGTVCDDAFDELDAALICSVLGHRGLIDAMSGSGSAGTSAAVERFGQGSGQIWLDNLGCTENSTDIESCRTQDWGSHNCGHQEDAGVICDAYPNNGDLRLVGGTVASEGRVEVWYGAGAAGSWGTVCDDAFDALDGNLICTVLGYDGVLDALSGDGSSATSRAVELFGQGTGSIWLDNLGCTENSTDIESCMTQPWGNHNCGHQEDAGVICEDCNVAQRTVTCYTDLANQHISYGVPQYDVTDLCGCSLACSEDAACVAFDYNFSDPPFNNVPCWFHTTSNDADLILPDASMDVTHYRYRC